MNKIFRIRLVIAVVLLLLALDVSAIAEDILDFVPIPGLKAAAKFAMIVAQNLLTLATNAVILAGLINTILPIAFPSGILWNPTIFGPDANSAVVGIIRTFIVILQPILVLWIVLIGLYLIFMTGSPAGRVRAKIMFWKAVFAMILFSLSMPFYQIILDISRTLAYIILDFGSFDSAIGSIIGDPVRGGIFGVANLLTPIFSFLTISILTPGALSETDKFHTLTTVTIIFMYLLTFAVPLVILLRYFVLTVLALFFPFALLFYFIDVPFIPFRGIGEKLMKLTFMWTFSQVVMALVLVGVSIAISNNPDTLLTVILSALGIFMIVAAPLMMTGIMRWIGAIMTAVGMTLGPGIGSMMIGVGMLLMGTGPLAALSTAGIHRMIWGFRPGSTESPLYATTAHATWQGWGIPPTGPQEVAGGKSINVIPVSKSAETTPNINRAGEYINRGEQNLKSGYGKDAQGNFRNALDELNEMHKYNMRKGIKDPKLAEEYFRLGKGFERAGNLSMAVKSYRIAADIATEPTLKAEYLKTLGNVYMKRL